ncbi:MAG: recombination protein RecR [Candidatus Sungbacteria bacterium RIFCSPLOWO2_02_FULL_51_17]|uniref:Recombination protein RecR n=1 Tax=Candidatus Sungbacteria bacterium RIFCSPHIGHO2_02_FULL_51_29 TaxID=1802273 RepID=A0A1G2KQR4_9BACT|nr:MAG: recombination protein RecR [Candidatus Sungbacteria bacterium RIFCSPHIGHO2_01_FULL_51_22]OHA01703.1 MAG: recombination protein RecR [Candidatus Sungbacteria bacterium RIFCSPHIGHO2_02_FULL_51_29]OHA07233.1 MAG: recombination protein RecR [Candidatus Sungbacteria bacterium RIFCSPLOWO2_01_FULL_51_34]OHA10991.1 MAG: recombination protein RecR [Candidatus Sungbacteria bacterium RIFCSPLOWO2_02_FULL_51_17]
MIPQPLQHLIDQFTKFPGIGPRQAARFCYYLLHEDAEVAKDLSSTLATLHDTVASCRECYKSVEHKHEDAPPLCEFCKNDARDETKILIVEKEQDLHTIERTKKFAGRYHVLGGTISPLDSSSPQKLHLRDLFERAKRIQAARRETRVEVILATNPTTEGDTTALYIERILKPLGVVVSRLGRGLGTGSELEYADMTTLENALTNRR